MASEPHELRLTLRTLLAYLDDTLSPHDTKLIGQKLKENPEAGELVERIKKVIRRRSLATPSPTSYESKSPEDPNIVAGYLSDVLSPERLEEFERVCLKSDSHLAEVAACHQILTMVLCEQIRVPPTAYQRMYRLVGSPESSPDHKPSNILPVGGMLPDAPAPAEGDEADAALLLGLSAYSRAEPMGKRAARWGIVLALLVGFLVTAILAWPKSKPQDDQAYAWLSTVTTPTTRPVEKVNPVEILPKPAPKEPDPSGPKKPDPQQPEPKKPDPQQPEPKKPLDELTPENVPPKAGEVPLGSLETADSVVLIAQKASETSWKRVGGNDSPVVTGERLVALPGYKARLKLENGAIVELWANLPDLLPYPVLETEAQFHIPYDGFAADLTLVCGRVYLTTSQPAGTKIRLRVLKEIWDITLPDARSEVALEVVNSLTPGSLPESPTTSLALHTIKGTAALTLRNKTIPTIKVGENVFWSNKGQSVEGPFPSTKQIGGDIAYFSRIPTYPQETAARRALEALDEFAKRATDSTRVRASIAELIREQDEVSVKVLMEGRIGVFATAAIRDLESLLTMLTDDRRHYLRQPSLIALREVLAAHPEREPDFQQQAPKKFDLTADQFEDFLRIFRGSTAEDRKNSGYLDLLYTGLQSKSLALREAAFFVLISEIDPAATKVKRLIDFNAAAPAELRKPFVEAWGKRIAELKAQALMPEKP